MQGKELLSAGEAASKLKITKRTILRWAREGKIECVRLSRKVVLFTGEAVDEFVRSKSRKVELALLSHPGARRETARPTLVRKGGDRKSSGESWSDLRKEVASWQ